jgi:SAM-dependent methyltransferase
MDKSMISKYKEYLDEGFEYACASKPAKGQDERTRIRIRPILLKKSRMFQVSTTVGTKEFHENLDIDDAAALLESVTGNPFLAVEAVGAKGKLCVLVSKKGHMTVKEHHAEVKKAQNDPIRSHNRQKNYLLPEGEPVPFLVELGVMTQNGKVIAQKYDKFRQINRYLEFVEDIIPSLPANREISIVDFGCGKSYLTFALYYYLKETKGYDVRITGLDLKADVIEKCNALAVKFGYDKLKFYVGDIAGFEAEKGSLPDMVVTLHACDTATDFALEKAVKWGARVIMCVPCCQHELNKQIECEILGPVMKYGLLKERFAALVTDGLRAQMLEEAGYRVQILEFIDMEHTPKNILIRAVRQPLRIKKKTGYEKTIEFLHADPTLKRLLDKE